MVLPPISPQDGLPVRESGPWIIRKYHYLRRYLEIFSVGMRKKWSRLTYIDLFAGPGKCVIGQTREETDGSALISLSYNFDRYIFVEWDRSHMDALKERCKSSGKETKVEFIPGDCNWEISKVRPQGLGVAFIDPTGIDFYYDTLRTLTTGRSVDLLMTIMLGMDIKRNLELYRRQGDNSELSRFLGGSVPWDRISNAQDVMVVYRERLRQLDYSTAEFKDIIVRNEKNVPMYFLTFASKHPRGLEFWEKISTVDETGQMDLL